MTSLVDRVHTTEDIELGSHGSKWRHGWIPLNAAATAIKLKQLKAGGRTHVEHVDNGRKITVAGNHKGGFGAVVEHPDGSSHYVEHETHSGALAMAKRHPSISIEARAKKAGTTPASLHKAEARSADRQQLHAAAVAEAKKRNSSAASELASKPRSAALLKAQQFAQDRYRANEAKRVGKDEESVAKSFGMTVEQFAKFKEDHKGDVAISVKDKPRPSRGVDKVTQKQRDAAMVGKVSPEQMLLGTREHQGVKYTVKKPGQNPFVPSDAHGVETSGGATAGYIRVKDGKLHIGADTGAHKLEEHQVKNVKEAVAGLHASHTLHLRGVQDKKDAAAKADDETRSTFKSRAEARVNAEREADHQEQLKAEKQQVREGNARRAHAADIVKGYTPTKTKNDTPTKQKAREALSSQLNASDVPHLGTNTHPDTLSPGQAVRFKAYVADHQNFSGASSERVGHVIHASHGVVHVGSINPGTGKPETHTANVYGSGKKASVGPVVTRDPEKDKALIEAARKQHAANVNTSNRQHDTGSVAGKVQAALDEMRKRNAAKNAPKPDVVKTTPAPEKAAPKLGVRAQRAKDASDAAFAATNSAKHENVKASGSTQKHYRAATAHDKASEMHFKLKNTEQAQRHDNMAKSHRARARKLGEMGYT